MQSTLKELTDKFVKDTYELLSKDFVDEINIKLEIYTSNNYDATFKINQEIRIFQEPTHEN